MKRLPIVLFLLFLGFAASAQKYTLSGKILDENNAPLPGAAISLQYPWGEQLRAARTQADGSFRLVEVPKGGYKLEVKLLGYQPLKGEFTLTDADLNIGVLNLIPEGLELSEVKIKATVPTGQMNGDTTEFNAGAFKVMSDASTEELLEKMPSVTVEDGTVKAQGEDVGQVLVDGKPFFGNDPSAALKNLPAEVVEKVQIFDAESDQAQFTGFSDGNTTKTINIVTRKDMRAGQFGKVYAGYGYEDKYQVGGNINVFDGDRRISLIGMSNNINIQNFAVDDILGMMGSSNSRRSRGRGRPPGGGRYGRGGTSDFLVRPQGGIATTHAAGLNYADQWGEKTSVSASYFFNNSENNADEFTYQQYLDREMVGQIYDEESFSTANNTNHRFNARINIKLDSMNSLLIRPRLTVQLNDGISNTFGETTLRDSLLGRTDNSFFSDLTGINLNNTLLWRHKFAKRGRTLSINLSNGFAPEEGASNLYSFNNYFTGIPENDTLDQQSGLDVNSWNMSSNIEYTEPLGEKGQLMANYRISYQEEDSDKQTFDFLEADGDYTQLNEQLTNVFSNNYTTQRAGGGYSYREGRDFSVSVRANAQWAELNNQRVLPINDTLNTQFFNVLPTASIRWNFNNMSNIRVHYRSRTNLPSVDQLQDVLDNSNPLQLSVGNPNLKQSVEHRVFARYRHFNKETSTSFFLMGMFAMTDNFIANSTFLASSDDPIFAQYDVQPGAQISLPVNIDGNYNLRSFISYGKPVNLIRCNLNFDGSYTYSRSPGLINNELNYAGTHAAGLGVTLSSNISDRVDFLLSTRPTYSIVRNTQQTGSNTEFMNFNSRIKFNWIIFDGFVLRTNVTHSRFSGLSDDYNQDFVMWNLAIGKKLFKNERGEIALAVNDLLNQNTNIQRNVTETYIEDLQTNALQQFFMLSFTYNLRHFNTGKESTRSRSGGDSRRGWGGKGD